MKIPNLSDMLCNTGAGYRNNNPGNRTGKDSVFGSGVETTSSHKWTRYKDWVDGYAGNTLLLLSYLDGSTKNGRKYGLGERNPCMTSVIYTWAPPSDGNNSSNYVSFMCSQCGIEPDDRIAITEKNLIAMELAKGCKDSGCVQRNACISGVKKAIAYYVKKGGHLDNTENLGKVENELIKNISNGIVVSDSSSSSASSAEGSNDASTINSVNYSNGTGTYEGTSWGNPIQKGNITSTEAFVKQNGITGVIVGTHIRQR